MQISKNYPNNRRADGDVGNPCADRMWAKGALYLPTNNSQQVADAAAKPTSTTANASDTKVDVNTQDPNVDSTTTQPQHRNQRLTQRLRHLCHLCHRLR